MGDNEPTTIEYWRCEAPLQANDYRSSGHGFHARLKSDGTYTMERFNLETGEVDGRGEVLQPGQTPTWQDFHRWAGTFVSPEKGRTVEQRPLSELPEAIAARKRNSEQRQRAATWGDTVAYYIARSKRWNVVHHVRFKSDGKMTLESFNIDEDGNESPRNDRGERLAAPGGLFVSIKEGRDWLEKTFPSVSGNTVTTIFEPDEAEEDDGDDD